MVQAQDMPSLSACKELANGETTQELNEFRKCLRNYQESLQTARKQALIKRRYEGSMRVVEGSTAPPAPGGNAPPATPNASANGR